MKAFFLISLMLLLIGGVVGCIKIPQPCSNIYSFEFPISVTPQDTFTVGDTIWMEMELNNLMLDHETGTLVDLEDFELELSFMVEEADPIVPVTGRGAMDLFNVIEEIGQLQRRVSTVGFYYLKTPSVSDKHFKIGLIPTKSNLYYMGISFPVYYMDLEHDSKEGIDISKDINCRENITHKSSISINNYEDNYHFISGLCRNNLQGQQYCYTDSTGNNQFSGYAFYVKEP